MIVMMMAMMIALQLAPYSPCIEHSGGYSGKVKWTRVCEAWSWHIINVSNPVPHWDTKACTLLSVWWGGHICSTVDLSGETTNALLHRLMQHVNTSETAQRKNSYVSNVPAYFLQMKTPRFTNLQSYVWTFQHNLQSLFAWTAEFHLWFA